MSKRIIRLKDALELKEIMHMLLQIQDMRQNVAEQTTKLEVDNTVGDTKRKVSVPE